MPPPLVGEALAFRDVFQQTQISFIENDTSLPRAPLPGELAPQASERLDKGRLSSERNNTGAALYNLSDIFASLDATSPDKGRLCGGEVLSQHRVLLRNETSLPRALLPGELAPQASERLDKGRLSSERNNAGAALYNLSDIFASLDATSPSRGGFGIP